jgi:hypothetical protein
MCKISHELEAVQEVVISGTFLRMCKEYNELYHLLNGDKVPFVTYHNSLFEIAGEIYKELLDIGFVPQDILNGEFLELYVHLDLNIDSFEIDNVDYLNSKLKLLAKNDFNTTE